MLVHRIFLLLWILDLSMFPVLAVLDLGFSFDVASNYLLRYSYFSVFFVAVWFIFFRKKRIVNLPIVHVFIFVFAIGSLKGLWEGHINSAFLSHVYYVLMPLIMISYGWFFFDNYARSDLLQKTFNKVMYIAFYVGLIAVFVFQFAYQSGLSAYDAIGLWNFLFSGPFLLFQPNGAIYFGLSFLATLLAGKRVLIVVFIIFFLIYLLHENKNSIFKALTILLIGILISSLFFSDQFERVDRTLVALQQSDFDMAFAMRWSESISAINYLTDRFDHLLIGAGFGAQFLPWPNLPDYADYYSHYTHFSVVSFAWFGGIFFSLFIYGSLIVLGISLVNGIRRNYVGYKYRFFVYWLWGIILSSFSGADLMNNPYLWFIVGCCLHLNKLKFNEAGKLLPSSVNLN